MNANIAMPTMHAPPHRPALETLLARHATEWQALWQGLGIAAPDPALLPALLQRYAEPHRHYHTQQHLDACLAHFVKAQHLAQHPCEVALALWFHDAIYDIGATDNELRSAEWAREALLAAGTSSETAQRVHALVMVTRHDCAPATPDEALLLDIDLSILGQQREVFNGYEEQVRVEFASVPEAVRRARRSHILQQFLDRPRIYHTAHFHDALEVRARDNLQRSIHQLSAG